MRSRVVATAIAIAFCSTIANPASAVELSERAVAVAPQALPAAAVVDAFHAALRKGDTDTAQSHLSDEALIYESGGVERGRKEYASHHLGADAAFAKAVPSTTTRRTGEAVGDVAWIVTEGRTTGTFKEKPLDRVTTETMILRRRAGVWKIMHIHWSSSAKK
jgi:ketosteroid isomerase-like protein